MAFIAALERKSRGEERRGEPSSSSRSRVLEGIAVSGHPRGSGKKNDPLNRKEISLFYFVKRTL